MSMSFFFSVFIIGWIMIFVCLILSLVGGGEVEA